MSPPPPWQKNLIFPVAKWGAPVKAPAHNSNLPNMADSNISDKVRDIIVQQLGVNPEQVTPQAKFIEDLGADSLDTVELVMAFEEEFEIEIPDEDAEKITRVKDAVEYIEKNAKGKK